MKKVIGFVVIVILFFAALSYYNIQKTREKIVGADEDEYRKIRDVRLTIGSFNLAMSNYAVETLSSSISVENLIAYFNNISTDRKAILNNNGSITVTNLEEKYIYDCEIITENCKSKIVCLEQSSHEFFQNYESCK